MRTVTADFLDEVRVEDPDLAALNEIRAAYGTPVAIDAADTERWFVISRGNLRDRDYIRFTTSMGRTIEGTARKQADGTFCCNFETINKSLVQKWYEQGQVLERRGLPELTYKAIGIIDAIGRLNGVPAMRLAIFNSLSAGEAVDLLPDFGHEIPWWGVWAHAQRLAVARIRTLPVEYRQFAMPASDTIAAAAVSANFGIAMPPKVRARFDKGYRAAIEDQARANRELACARIQAQEECRKQALRVQLSA